MKITNGAVPVYTVAGSDTTRYLPDWLQQKQKKNRKRGDSNLVELLQDFSFEEASQCIRISPDGQWVMSTGTYKPQIHTHYLPNLSLSWARHTDTLNKTFLLISSDYSKSIHLQEDRSLEFHTPSGRHHTLRLPRYGRDLAYDRTTAEVLVPLVGVDSAGLGAVHRVNLELGRFMTEFTVDVGGDDMTSAGGGALQGGIGVGGVNTAAMAEDSHNLYAFGTSIGTVEYWDPRSRTKVATLGMPHDLDGRPEVTAMSFHRSGIQHAIGTSSGLVYLYDLRSPSPMLKKDQGYGFPIQHVEFLTPSTNSRIAPTEPRVLSGDKRVLKIWDQRTGNPWASVEPSVDINCVAWCKDSGMILTANEGKQQHAFFIPQLGPAPKWCTFLDNVVEEMADDPNDPHSTAQHRSGETYDNYKFLTLTQLRGLSLDHLVGKTNLLRPYMHGYFVAQRLYEEARLIVNPSSWEDERAKRVQAKIDKERESRIRGQKKVAAKVNRKMVERILEREAKNERKRAQRVLAQGGDLPLTSTPNPANEISTSILEDSRFSRLFNDEDFAIDENSREFQQLNPSTKTGATSNLEREHERGLTAVEREALDNGPRTSDSSDSEEGRAHLGATSNEKVSTLDYRRQSKKRRTKRSEDISLRVLSSSDSKRPVVAARDRTFASRAHDLQSSGSSRIRTHAGTFGDQTTSFEPKGRSRSDSGAIAKSSKRVNDRRSASKNTFRGM